MAATCNVLGLLLLLIVHPAASESYCPAIALRDRSTLDPVGTKGFPVTFYQIFYTEGFAHKLNICWVRHPGNLSLSRNYSKNVEFQDKHTVNASLIIYDAQPFPAEGTYTVTASSNCTSNGTQFYLQMYSCNVSAVPQPLEAHNMTVIPETALPDELHLRVPFHGSPDTGWSNTNWMYENKDFCTENSFSPNPRIDCNRTRISPQANCTFTADLWISKPDYTNSGPYTVNAISTFAQPPSNNSTIDLHIVPQPRIGNCTTGHKTISTGSHFHLECQITAYSDFVNVTVVKNDRKLLNYSARDICWHHEPDKTVATCAVDIQVSGNSRFKLCVGYNNTVPHRSLPLCSEDMHVTLKQEGQKTLWIAVGSGGGGGALVILLVIAVIIIFAVCLIKKRKVYSAGRQHNDKRGLLCSQDNVPGEITHLILPSDEEHKDSERDCSKSKETTTAAHGHEPATTYGATGNTVRGDICPLQPVLEQNESQKNHHSVKPVGVETQGTVDDLPVLQNGPPTIKRQRSKTGSHLLPKVTVIYAHNPELYTQIEEPKQMGNEERKQYERDVLDNEKRREQNIKDQKKLVKEFVHRLLSWGIAVAYDQQLDDCKVENRRLWMEVQIKDSDYVIFIITPSFKHFMMKVAPDEEMMFQGQYLHNLMSNPEKNVNKEKIALVSVFLNKSKVSCRTCIPKTLETGNIYELWISCSSETEHQGDWESFYNFIMGRKVY